MKAEIPTLVKFERKIARSRDTECWLWVGSVGPQGYGAFWDSKQNRRYRAHRAAWELYVGPIPDDICVLHKCDVRHCVNPDHLFLGDRADNFADMWAKGRYRAGRGTEMPNAKLNDAAVRAIRRSSKSQRAIAREYGVDQSLICLVQTRKSWKHVT